MALASLRARRYGTGLRRFAKTNVMSATAGVVGLLLILISIAAPVIAPADPLKVKLSDINADPSIRGEFIPFGRDHIGRDVLSRVIYGGRISLFVGFVAVLLGTSGGFVWGLTSGYFGGKFDLINQRVVEVLLSFPGLILAMALAMALGASMWTVIIAIGVTRLAPSARVVRAVALSIKETTYVDAARALGANPLRIMTAHIAPQCVAPFLIVFTASLGGAIVTEASLSFLGVGIPPPDPSWGTMLAEASGILLPHWYLVVFPGLFITVTVLAFNLFGDGLRDALDPRLRGST
jgi:ABC-type dipeptide/oligopeptide/nickel transport system permease subunit